MAREKPAYKIRALDLVPVYGLVRYFGRNTRSDEEFAKFNGRDIDSVYPNSEEFLPRAIALGTYHLATLSGAIIAGAAGLINLVQNLNK